MRNRQLFFSALVAAAGLSLLAAACGKDKDCTKDSDCKSREICQEGKCIQLAGESGSALSREVDDSVTYKVPVDPKKNAIKGPKYAPVTIVEYSDFQ